MSIIYQTNGLIQDPSWRTLCKHPEHYPPSYRYIPTGEVYVHKCPCCGNEIKITNNLTCWSIFYAISIYDKGD